jgi:hypothetical protein
MSRRLAFTAIMSGMPMLAQGEGISPYLPIDLPPQVGRQIERVLMLADQPVIRRPIALARVRAALPRACARDVVLCGQVERYLARFTAGLAVTDAQLELAAAGGDAVPVANRRGLDSDDGWSASAAVQWRPAEHVLVGIGAQGRPGSVVPTGSLVSVGTARAQLDVGYRDRWTSALTDSSFLMSTEAATMPSVTLSNSRPLGRLGFSYELFVARMSRSSRIGYQGGLTSGHPQLAGTSFLIEPAPGWSLGLNRLMQFGGGARSGSNLADLFRAFVDPSGYDNTRTGSSTDNEFGNQQAAWTSSFIYPGSRPFIVSFEYAGEDTSHSTSGRLGNAALSMGLRFPRFWRDVGLTYEVSEWQNGWYAHHIYYDGMVNDGRILGHWGAARRRAGDDVGARSQMLRLDWETRAGGSIELQLRTLKNAAYSTTPYRQMNEIGVSYSRPFRNAMVGSQLLLGRDPLGKDYLRLSAFTRLLDGAGSGRITGDVADSAGNDRGAAVFVDLGVALSRVRIDLDHGTVPVTTTAAQAAPHLGLGVRRAVADRSDLGARIELDRVDGHTLLAVRAVDYRYRVNARFAVTAFAGAARYDLLTPAYGYYLGTGVQWRDIVPRWDLNFDLRYGDKIARDHVLPQEAGIREPDSFHDIHGVSLSMSRSF